MYTFYWVSFLSVTHLNPNLWWTYFRDEQVLAVSLFALFCWATASCALLKLPFVSTATLRISSSTDLLTILVMACLIFCASWNLAFFGFIGASAHCSLRLGTELFTKTNDYLTWSACKSGSLFLMLDICREFGLSLHFALCHFLFYSLPERIHALKLSLGHITFSLVCFCLDVSKICQVADVTSVTSCALLPNLKNKNNEQIICKCKIAKSGGRA